MSKEVQLYGVSMTSLEGMKFSKYLSNNGIAMNTLTTDQRFDVAKKWLEINRAKPINND